MNTNVSSKAWTSYDEDQCSLTHDFLRSRRYLNFLENIQKHRQFIQDGNIVLLNLTVRPEELQPCA